MKIGIVQFPGSNCERETKLAIQRIGLEAEDCFWHSSAESISQFDGFIIIGGFSYEDRVRSGLIAAQDPVMKILTAEAAKGKPILGVCNGAQILVESGLLPPMALTVNKRVRHGKLVGTGFYNEWVYVKGSRPDLSTPIRIPIAHAEGRFLIDPQVYQALQQANALFYYYCDEKGEIDSHFPCNPNGSMYNLAAVGNECGNILAMMPHPERTPEGDMILKSFFQPEKISKKALENALIRKDILSYKPYIIDDSHLHYWVKLLIHDNEAITLENVLQNRGFPITVKKLIHWEIDQKNADDDVIIRNSDELFNRQKEHLVKPDYLQKGKTYIILHKDDEMAANKQQKLHKLLGRQVNLKREVVWAFDYPIDEEESIKKMIEKENLLGNPLSHEGFIL